jgi:MATE family multidrug resistance protein
MADRFIRYYDLGLKGAAWSKNLSSLFMALLVYIYIAKYHSHHPSWCEWDKRALKNLLRFTKPIMKITIKLFLQSSIFEAMVLVAMFFNVVRMTVMICLVFTAQAIFMIHLGIAQQV